MAKWNDIEQSEIAQTIRDVARYIQDKNIGPEHNKLTQDWLDQGGLADQIDQMDQNAIAYLFGEGDGQGYWPGKFRPTLMDLKTGLEFFIYREDLEELPPEAQSLTDRIRRFDGFGGSRHLACTGYSHEVNAYIDAAPRHPSECYRAPNTPTIDVTNSVNYAFNWAENKWLPLDDEAVEARLKIGGNGNAHISKYDELARYKASIEEGYRRANISVDVSIELGHTYGEDALVLHTNMGEYTKYIEIKRGERDIDLSPTEALRGWGDLAGPFPSDTFKGFELNKAAFCGPGGTYVCADTIEKTNLPAVANKVEWLRSTDFISEKDVLVASSSGQAKYIIFSRKFVPRDQEPFIVEQKYWGSTDLHNGMIRKLHELYDALNGGTGESLKKVQKSKLTSEWFEHAGKIYVQRFADAFEQAAFHFKATHGLEYSPLQCSSAPDELKALTTQGAWNELHIDKIPDDQKAQLHGVVVRTLNEIKNDINSGNTGMGLSCIAPKPPKI